MRAIRNLQSAPSQLSIGQQSRNTSSHKWLARKIEYFKLPEICWPAGCLVFNSDIRPFVRGTLRNWRAMERVMFSLGSSSTPRNWIGKTQRYETVARYSTFCLRSCCDHTSRSFNRIAKIQNYARTGIWGWFRAQCKFINITTLFARKQSCWKSI